MIKFGSIEYYELIELKEKLNQKEYNKFDLKNLDKLRLEIDIKIANINVRNKMKGYEQKNK